MHLSDALIAVAPAVGDGKLIPQHAYVMAQGNVLHATDGRQWVQVLLDLAPEPVPDFCVRYEALKRALERDGLRSMVSDGHYGLKLSYGRGRAFLKGIDITSFPVRQSGFVEQTIRLPEDFTNRIRDLMNFCANGDGHIWQQAVHLTSNFMFAANSFALAKYPTEEISATLGVPTWACQFISEQADSPIHLRDRRNVISFVWANGIELFTSLLTEQPPDNALSLAVGLIEPFFPIPDDFKETIDRLKDYGAKTCRIGDGRIVHRTEELELEDDTLLAIPPRTWGVESLSNALQHATALDLSGPHGVWKGSGYVGVFSGRSD